MADERRLTVKVAPETFKAIKIHCANTGQYLGVAVSAVLDKEFVKSRKRPEKSARLTEKVA